MAGEDNLKPGNVHGQTPQQAQENGAKGGVASGIAKRKKKLFSEIYADFLMKKHKLKDGSEMTGQDLVEDTMLKVLQKGSVSSVSMLKEAREASEGNKVTINTSQEVEDAKRQILTKIRGASSGGPASTGEDSEVVQPSTSETTGSKD